MTEISTDEGEGYEEEEEIYMGVLPSGQSIRSASDLFRAVELGIVDKTEARRLLGFETKRGRSARSQSRSSQGRFTPQDPDELMVLQSRAMRAARQQLGDDHPATLVAKINLAAAYASQGRLEAARQLYQEVGSARREKLGTDHPNTLTAISALAGVMADQGQLEEARRLQEDVLNITAKQLGAGHPDTLAVKRNLAGTLADLGNLDEAQRLEREIEEEQAKSLGRSSAARRRSATADSSARTGGAHFVAPGEGETLSKGDRPVTLKLGGQQTNDAFEVLHFTVEENVLRHVHDNEDEAIVVLDGTVTVRLGEENPFEAARGSVVFVPRGVPRQIDAPAKGKAEVLAVSSPPGQEQYWRSSHEAEGDRKDEARKRIQWQHGIRYTDTEEEKGYDQFKSE